MSGSTSSTIAAPIAATPARSSGRGRRAPAGRQRHESQNTAIPIGILTRNAGRQVVPSTSAEISSPPRLCPATAPADNTSAYRPRARARARPSKPSWIPVRTCAVISAAAPPAAIRAATSAGASGASPQASDAAVNRPTPARNMRRYPRVSPSRANVTSSVA
jgi:hypothetical protein